jgi:hypothetical protein
MPKKKEEETAIVNEPQQPARPPMGYGERGVELGTANDAWAFAQKVASSGLAPKGLEKPEAILIAIQMGAELGLPPMASLQNIAVINGRPSIWGDAMLAVCRASELFDEAAFVETVTKDPSGELTATCSCRRLPDGQPIIREFSLTDAKTAGLAGKSGPWQQYPKRMLQMRARSWALRDAFTDLLRGLITAEEARDIPATKVEQISKIDQLTDRLASKNDHVEIVEPETEPEPEPEPEDTRNFELES